MWCVNMLCVINSWHDSTHFTASTCETFYYDILQTYITSKTMFSVGRFIIGERDIET